MKTMTEGMRLHLAQGALKLATCWKITRTDGEAFRFTDHDQDIIANNGELYKADTGFSRSSGASKTDMSVDNSNMQGLLDASQIDPNDVRAGLFDHAEIRIFLVNHEEPEEVRANLTGTSTITFSVVAHRLALSDPVASWLDFGFEVGMTIAVSKEGSANEGVYTVESILGVGGKWLRVVEDVVAESGKGYTVDSSPNGDGMGMIKIRRGNFGEVSIRENQYEAAIRGMTQVLTRPLGQVTSPLCPVDLFSTKCGLDYTSFKVSTTVYTVVDNRTITLVDGQLTEATGYYDGGSIKWTGGANDGITMEVETWDVDTDTLVLFMPMPFDIAVNDPFDIIPGCKKRHTEDCITKYDNGLNFRGFPHIPGVDKLMETPDARTV